ncbi:MULTISPECIES: hypothetical protein [unclassified Psychrobacillus]|uniref:hypothetical protein n=1 Tax=unclassified Psychrobacillus TaxID=2636677 RepID=UPI0030F502B9
MKKYKVIALENLEAENNSWTKGLDYEVTETATKFQITSNEAQVAYVIMLKEAILINFKEA